MSRIVTVTERKRKRGLGAIPENSFPIVVTLWAVESHGSKVNLTEREALDLGSELRRLVFRRRTKRAMDGDRAAARYAAAKERANIQGRLDRGRDDRREREQKGPDMTGSDHDPETWGEERTVRVRGVTRDE